MAKTVQSTIGDTLGGWRNINPTKSILAAIAWSCVVIDENSLNDEGKKIIDVLCGVIFAAEVRSL